MRAVAVIPVLLYHFAIPGISGGFVGAFPAIRDVRVSHLIGIAGVVAIAACVLALNEDMLFPGWLALVPCLGTAAVIWASQSGGGAANQALCWSPLVYVGR